jgi:hypothetical protein
MKSLTFIFTLLTTTLFGQIDYPRGLELISTDNPVVTITWIRDASRSVPLYFNQRITFINTKTDALSTSRVIATITHNGRSFKSFEFKVGEDIVNHLYTSNPIKLNVGDSVTIKIQLKSTSENEEYVFNIYDQKLSSSSDVKYASVTSIKKQPVVASTSKQKPERQTTSDELKRLRRARTVEGIFRLVAR